MSLKEKTISGLYWNFLGLFANRLFQFIIGIILARLLTPKEYGLTGMIAIFLAISDVFIISGFGEALIRKKDASKDDYSTIFIFNILVGIICYALLVGFSGTIGRFFNEPLLKDIVIVYCSILIINAFALVPGTQLTKSLDFKRLTKISLFTAIISGGIAVYLAYKGFGVWSLVWKGIIASFLRTSLLYWFVKPEMSLIFNTKSFKELFGFSSKLLLSSLINQLYLNIYYLVIAKYFSARELGLYSRADHYKDLPSRTLNSLIQGVSYPVLAQIKDNPVRLKNAYRKIITGTMYITFILMLGLAATADNAINGLIGSKWAESIPYLQLLCFAGMLYPLHSLNLNMLNVQGRSDLFLKLEIIKKSLAVPTIIIGIFFGIKIMIIGMIFNSFLAYFLNSYWSGKMINYSMKEQVMDIIPSFIIATFISIFVFILGYLTSFTPLTTLLIQITIGALLVMGISEWIKPSAYLEMKAIFFEKINKMKVQKTTIINGDQININD